MERRFIQCDVFTETPTKGNGLAVVVDGAGLSTARMQDFAAWTNLAETSFLMPPEDKSADYRVRIFTPVREMPFAGHPTLGSAAAWLHCGGRAANPDLLRQECGVGIVEIETTGTVPAFIAPPTRISSLGGSDFDRILAATGIDAGSVLATAVLENGPTRHVLELDSAEAVLAARADRVRFPDFTPIGLIGPHPPGGDIAYEVRMLAPSSGMAEDPITGSLHAVLAHWLAKQGRLTRPIIAAQGTAMGRAGRVHIRPHPERPDQVLIGGATQILIEGMVRL